MSRFALLPIALLAALATNVAAQTSTTCNPLNATCPSDPALGTIYEQTYNASMTGFDAKLFTIEAGTDLIDFTNDGAALTIAEEGQSVTLKTNFYIFFGRVEMIFKAAAGTGIISTFNLLSDDLDEIDWEIKGSNYTTVSNNYYGWGNTSQFNSEYPTTTGGSWGSMGAMGDFHNYTVVWTQEQLQWILDDAVVRTVPYAPAGEYPQSPSFLKFGIWAGGASSEPNGTRVWAGGNTDFSKGPFTMTVQSLKIVDGTTGASSYSYGDNTGTYQSIKVADGQSDAYKEINAKTYTQTVEQQWSGLSTGAKIGIAAGIGGAFLLAAILFIFYCMKQRKQGAAEKALADQKWDQEQAEFMEYRNRMRRGDFAVGFMGHGEKF